MPLIHHNVHLPKMSRVVIDLTGPRVSTRTRSKSCSTSSIDARRTKAAKAHVAQHVNETTVETPPTKKRKRATLVKGKELSTSQLNIAEKAGTPSKKAKKMPDSPGKDEHGEKRLRRFRERAPQSYLERLARANSQRSAHRAVYFIPMILNRDTGCSLSAVHLSAWMSFLKKESKSLGRREMYTTSISV